MKKVSIFIAVIIIAFVSCKPKGESDTEDNSRRTDSLLKVINSPELAAVNKKILENPDDATLYQRFKTFYKNRL
jgi:hypothetical protein